MNRERGGQRPPLSALDANNGGGAAAAAPDAMGSSSKDRAWQRRTGLGAPSRFGPQSDKKKAKKVEGSVMAPGPAGPASASRIPAGPGARPAAPPHQQAPASSSRIPRPPVFGAAAAAGGASPQTDLVAMLATPQAPLPLDELHTGGCSGGGGSSSQLQQPWQPAAAAPQGFQAYANPSFDGAQFLSDTPPAAPAPGAAAPCSSASASLGAAGRVFFNGLAEAEAEAGAATPGLLDPASLTPNTERSLQAWLRGSPSTAAGRRGASTAPATRDASAGGRAGGSSAGALPTPEAWQMLQHINDDSPPAAAPQGVRGLMNAYLRTGPQMLSPEPAGGAGACIRAPDAAAVPAAGLLNVAGPGGAGVLGIVSGMHAYLRTSAHQLSPEPGQEAAPGQLSPPQLPAPLLHPYSPVSPLAPTPAAGPRGATPPAGAAAERGPISPSSVCSNGAVPSSGPAAASVPRLDLSALRRQQQQGGGGGGTDGTEVSFGTVVPAAEQQEQQQQQQQQQQPDSPGAGELPTARFSPAAAEAPQAAEQGAAREAAGRHRPPSPISFCLPGDSPAQQAAHQPASDSPTFSFGLGLGAAPAGPAGGAAVAVEQQVAVEVQVQAVAAAAGAAGLPRLGSGSGETVQGPNPFTAMLQHLRGPQYASPARFPLRAQASGQGSPQSPRELTPLHLISASSPGDASPPRAAGPTPAPGQGSMTVWMDRRGMRAALSTPARNDLRLLWAAARDVAVFQSEAAALRADNAALAAELEDAQAALAELGLEQRAAVVAAEAGALCAEAEVAKARDAAGHMMALAAQIQAMFQLCESEKDELVGELEAARAKLAASEAAAADATTRSDAHQGQLAGQLEEARTAVAAAQAAADAAQQRASTAAAELQSIRAQLAEAQQQLAAAEHEPAAAAAAPAGTPAGQTPLGRLQRQLGGLHDSLAQLHAEHCAGRLQAPTPDLDRVEQLLGRDASALREQNARLAARLHAAHGLLAEHSPAGAPPAAAYLQAAAEGRGRSPLPFALFGRLGSSEGEGAGDFSPASVATATLGGCPSPDLFASPLLLGSQATLTVDYRDLAPPSGGAPSVRQGTPSTPSASSLSEEGSARSLASDGGSDALAAPAAAAEPATPAEQEQDESNDAAAGPGRGYAGEEEEEEEVTVVHNGMIITHVPASQVSKVKSMVQWWEAVASGTPLPAAASAEEAAAAEAYANAAIAAAEAALAAQQEAAQAAAQEEAAAVAAEEGAGAGDSEAAAGMQPANEPSPEATPIRMLPAATPTRFADGLPAGDAATPGALPAAVAAGTPARLTPLSFVAPPPTPADGVDPQQAQQLHQLAVSMAAAAVAGSPAACTPASAQRTSGRLPTTPVGGTPLALAVTPLALSALRARLGGSAGGVQDAVRSRLARLKADLAAAQAKLATVDQGLASIALTPTSSITNSGTPGSRSSSLLRRTPLTPSTAGGSGPLGSPLPGGAAAASPQVGQRLQLGSPGVDSSRAAALIAASAASPLAGLAGASPPGITQPIAAWREAPAEVQDSAPAPAGAAAAAAAECTPPVTRRSVRFADAVEAAGVQPQGFAFSPAAPAAAEQEQHQAAASAASPVVASCRRSPLGLPPAASPAATPLRRSPLAAMQSAAKPAGERHSPMPRYALGQSADDSDGSSSDDDDTSQLLFDASRMAQRANRAAAAGASPSPARLASASGATPMAHPEPPFGRRAGVGEEDEEAAEGYGSYSGRRGASATPGASVLSTSSFSPPQPLVLLAVRPLGRARRGGLARGGAGGRPRSEAEEREFRRRAAALNIPISPYFRRGG